MNELFSPIELKVLKILGNRTMTTIEISEKYCKGCDPIYEPKAVVCAAILRINKKCTFHKLPWFINGYGLGRGGRTFFKDVT